MVMIQLDENNWLSSDDLQWKIGRRTTERRGGKDYTYVRGKSFHGSLSEAFGYYLELRLKGSDATSMAELLEDYKKTKKDIKNILKILGE